MDEIVNLVFFLKIILTENGPKARNQACKRTRPIMTFSDGVCIYSGNLEQRAGVKYLHALETTVQSFN